MKFKGIQKILNSVIKNQYFWLTLTTLTTSIIFVPALNAVFWWVDDGYNFSISQKIFNSIIGLNFGDLGLIFNEQGGRFRLVYWFFQTLTYLIGGKNPTIYFFIHYLVILLSAYLIYWIVRNICKSNLGAFAASILFILSPINTENLYRLGPQEPLMCLFLLASLYYLFKNKLSLSVLFLLLTTLTKENGFVVWIPVFCLYLGNRIFFKKRNLNLEKYCIWGFVFTIPIVLNIILRQGGYSSNYIFDVGQVVLNFKSYLISINESFSPLFAILLGTHLFRLVLSFRNTGFKKYQTSLLVQGMYLILFLVFLIVQSPWVFVLNRYLMPATVGLVIFMGLELSGIVEILNSINIRYKLLWGTFFSIYFVTFIVVNMLQVYMFGERFAHQTRFVQSFYEKLATTVPPNGTILLNFVRGDSTIEYVNETKTQINLLYERPDVKVGYLDIQQLSNSAFTIVGTNLVDEGYAPQLIEKTMTTYQKYESPIIEKKVPVFTTTINLFKQVTIKTIGLILHKKPYTYDGIVAFVVSRDYWYAYSYAK